MKCDQVCKSASDIESLTLSLSHRVADIKSLTSSLWHWGFDINCHWLTNRSLLTFAWSLLITLEISWDLHWVQSSILLMSIQCKHSSHASQEESPEGPPPHPRMPHEATPESQRLQWAPLQCPKLHQASLQRSHQILHYTISLSILLQWSLNALPMFVLGLLLPYFAAHTQWDLGEIRQHGVGVRPIAALHDRRSRAGYNLILFPLVRGMLTHLCSTHFRSTALAVPSSNSFSDGMMHTITHHFHLLISAAGAQHPVEPADLLNLLWEAPHREINTKKPGMTNLIFSSHGWKMITW